MSRHRILRVLKFVLLVVLAATVFSFATMWLWNRLMPAIFGLHAISYWQALGLLVLSKIFFGGGSRAAGFAMHWRHRMMARWEQMTPEEREKFRSGLRTGCGPFGSSPATPKA
jgi:hypothetical protein